MTEQTILIRLTDKEKCSIKLLAEDNGQTVSEYIRNKVLYENPEYLTNNELIEMPAQKHHCYLMFGTLIDTFHVLIEYIKTQTNEEQLKEISERAHSSSKEIASRYGYRKIKSEGR